MNGLGNLAVCACVFTVSPLFASAQSWLYVANSGDGKLLQISPDRSVGVFSSGFSTPRTLSWAPGGDLVVADWGALSAARIGKSGVVQTLVSSFSHVQAAAYDSQGNLFYTTNEWMGVIYRLSTSGTTTSIYGPGLPGLQYPTTLAFDPRGNLLFTCREAGEPFYTTVGGGSYVHYLGGLVPSQLNRFNSGSRPIAGVRRPSSAAFLFGLAVASDGSAIVSLGDGSLVRFAATDIGFDSGVVIATGLPVFHALTSAPDGYYYGTTGNAIYQISNTGTAWPILEGLGSGLNGAWGIVASAIPIPEPATCIVVSAITVMLLGRRRRA
jgi:hypothetical protein